MNNNKEALNAIIQHGIDGLSNVQEDVEAADLHHYLYNEDYFVIGYGNADQFLESYGVMDAIRLVKDYEQDNFGEVTTDLADSEKVANMVAYIEGEAFLNECKTLQRVWDKKLTGKMIDSIAKELQAQIVN